MFSRQKAFVARTKVVSGMSMIVPYALHFPSMILQNCTHGFFVTPFIVSLSFSFGCLLRAFHCSSLRDQPKHTLQRPDHDPCNWSHSGAWNHIPYLLYYPLDCLWILLPLIFLYLEGTLPPNILFKIYLYLGVVVPHPKCSKSLPPSWWSVWSLVVFEEVLGDIGLHQQYCHTLKEFEFNTIHKCASIWKELSPRLRILPIMLNMYG